MRSIVFALGCFFVACTGSSGSPAAPDGGASRSLTCAAVFDCASACTDDPCSNVCLSHGSDEAQQAANLLAKCFNDNQCTDAACLQTNCQAEVDGCLAQGKPVGTPLGDAGGPPGDVPAELVGSWVHAAWGQTERFKLSADGTGYYQTAITSGGSCAVTDQTIWNGTVVVDATTITVYATTVTNTRNQCGQKTTTNGAPKTLRFTYTFDANTSALAILDADCVAKYPDSPSSQLLYCKNDYTRE